METRQRSIRTNENEIVKKPLKGATGRTTLGLMDKNSADLAQDGPQKPVVRMTRAQELRKKALDAKKAEQKPKMVRQKALKKEEPKKEEPSDEAMDISVVETENLSASLQAHIAEIEKAEMAEEHYVGNYVNTCYQYLRFQEHDMAIEPRYLDNKTDISPKMRSILVDWLVQVHRRFRLQAETLYLTVGIMDRYLAQAEDISKSDMQLIGVTSMMMACKYEEIYSPEIDDFVYICDNAYEAEAILKKELEIFEDLDFKLGIPISIQFLRRLSKTNQDVVDGQQHSLAKYFIELSLMDYDLCTLKPSLLAAAALKLSLELLGNGEWGPLLQHYSEYSADDLVYTVNLLSRCLYQVEFTKTGAKLSAIKKKYSEAKLFNISSCPEIEAKKDLLHERARKAKESLAANSKK